MINTGKILVFTQIEPFLGPTNPPPPPPPHTHTHTHTHGEDNFEKSIYNSKKVLFISLGHLLVFIGRLDFPY